MKSILTAFFFLIVSVAVQAQSVDEIIDKHLEVMGGKELMSTIKTMRMTGTTQIQPGMDAPLVVQVVHDRAMRMDLEIMNMKMTIAVKGDEGWQIMPFQGKKDAEPLPEDQIKTMKDQLDATGDLYNYAAKGSTVELVGTDDLDGTEVYKIKLTKSSGNVIYHFIDKESYYDLQVTTVVTAEGKDMEMSQGFSNFQKTDSGLVVAMSGTGGMGDVKWEKIELNPEIDMTIFDMPKPGN